MELTPEIEGKSSKYHVVARPDGFAVSGKDRGTVEVEMNGTSFVVTDGGRTPDEENPFGSTVGGESVVGLCEFYKMNSTIADQLMSAWTPPKDKPACGWVHAWARQQTEGAINARIHEQWKRLLTKADQRVVDVQKSLFAATMTCPPIAHARDLYENKFVVSDIIITGSSISGTMTNRRMPHSTVRWAH